MSYALIGAAAISAGSAIFSGSQSKKAAKKQRRALLEAQRMDLEHQEKMWHRAQELLAPFRDLGLRGGDEIRAALGYDGAEAQEAFVSRVMSSPMFDHMNEVGEEAILANAAATGGLRGGDVQQALAQQRTGNLAGLAERRIDQAMSLADLGSRAAGGGASLAPHFNEGGGRYTASAGAATAAGITGAAGAYAGGLNDIASTLAVFGERQYEKERDAADRQWLETQWGKGYPARMSDIASKSGPRPGET